MNNKKTLKIFMLPLAEGNPYQSELINSLKQYNIEVEGTTKLLFLFQLLKYQPDVIHFHWLHVYFIGKSKLRGIVRFVFFLFQISIIKILRISIVWTVHNLENHEKKSLYLERFITKIISKSAMSIIVHCNTAKSLLLDKFSGLKPDKIVVINHGHFINNYKSDSSQNLAKKHLSLNQDDFVLLFLGQIRSYKGVSDLVESFASLPEQKNLKLLIAGKPHTQELEFEIYTQIGSNKNIVFLPEFIPDSDIANFFLACDIVVLPYKSILTSGALILAMGFGKSVIIPDIGCLPETVHPEAKVVYRANDSKDLANAILEALNNRDELARKGVLNYEKAATFTWEKVAEETNRAYRRMFD